MRKIPEEVIKASGLPDEELVNLEYLGKYKGDDVYCYSIPNMITGFPIVYIMSQAGQVRNIYGHDALDFLQSFKRHRR